MDWKDIAATVGKVAPLLGTLLTGPAGAAVAVGGMIASALGTDADPEQVARALADPDALVKLREIEARRQTDLEGLATELAKVRIQADVQDRMSAREREVKARDSATPRVLAGVIVAGFLGTVYMVLAGHVQGLKDPVIAATVGTLIGYVSAKADQVVSYYFGSSAGSREKTELLAKR